MSSSAGDGPSGPIRLFPFLLKLFTNADWDIKPLLKLQRDRISLVVKDLKEQKVRVSAGHYHDLSELSEEVDAHIEALQSLLLSPTVPIK